MESLNLDSLFRQNKDENNLYDCTNKYSMLSDFIENKLVSMKN
jgi:hypothetical protein